MTREEGVRGMKKRGWLVSSLVRLYVFFLLAQRRANKKSVVDGTRVEVQLRILFLSVKSLPWVDRNIVATMNKVILLAVC